MPNDDSTNDELFNDGTNLPEDPDDGKPDWRSHRDARQAERRERQRIERENRISEERLDFWGDETRAGIPPELARGAIFRLPRRGRRRHFNREILIKRPSLSIGFTGNELDQFDGEVYLAIIRALRGQHIGERIEISLKGLAHELRRVKSGGTVKNIKEALWRLSSCTLHLKFTRNDKHYSANIHLMGWLYEEETRKTYVRLYADAEGLFQQLAWVDFEKHLALPSNMAKMLHMYVTSHRRGARRSVTLDELIEVSGWSARRNDFRSRLRDALNTLKNAGIIDEIEITADDVIKWRLLEYAADPDKELGI